MLFAAILSAIFAGLVAIVATVAIERLGGKVGGVLASIPTTIVPASLGFWWQSETATANFRAEMVAVPLGMLVNVLFLWSWRIFPSRLRGGAILAKQLMISLGVWLLAASCIWAVLRQSSSGNQHSPLRQLIGQSKNHSIVDYPLLLSISALLLSALLGFLNCRKGLPAPKGTQPVSAYALLFRGLLAAAAIGFAVVLSTMGTAYLAGLASVFPAIFLTTMVSLWIAQGQAVQVGSVGPMMLGSCSVSGYALLTIGIFPMFGPILGSIIAWVLSVLLCSLPAGLWLMSQRAS